MQRDAPLNLPSLLPDGQLCLPATGTIEEPKTGRVVMMALDMDLDGLVAAIRQMIETEMLSPSSNPRLILRGAPESAGLKELLQRKGGRFVLEIVTEDYAPAPYLSYFGG
jgi:hypothetical protein